MMNMSSLSFFTQLIVHDFDPKSTQKFHFCLGLLGQGSSFHHGPTATVYARGLSEKKQAPRVAERGGGQRLG
jgi:hypothetical protein